MTATRCVARFAASLRDAVDSDTVVAELAGAAASSVDRRTSPSGPHDLEALPLDELPDELAPAGLPDLGEDSDRRLAAPSPPRRGRARRSRSARCSRCTSMTSPTATQSARHLLRQLEALRGLACARARGRVRAARGRCGSSSSSPAWTAPRARWRPRSRRPAHGENAEDVAAPRASDDVTGRRRGRVPPAHSSASPRRTAVAFRLRSATIRARRGRPRRHLRKCLVDVLSAGFPPARRSIDRPISARSRQPVPARKAAPRPRSCRARPRSRRRASRGPPISSCTTTRCRRPSSARASWKYATPRELASRSPQCRPARQNHSAGLRPRPAAGSAGRPPRPGAGRLAAPVLPPRGDAVAAAGPRSPVVAARRAARGERLLGGVGCSVRTPTSASSSSRPRPSPPRCGRCTRANRSSRPGGRGRRRHELARQPRWTRSAGLEQAAHAGGRAAQRMSDRRVEEPRPRRTDALRLLEQAIRRPYRAPATVTSFRDAPPVRR